MGIQISVRIGVRRGDSRMLTLHGTYQSACLNGAVRKRSCVKWFSSQTVLRLGNSHSPSTFGMTLGGQCCIEIIRTYTHGNPLTAWTNFRIGGRSHPTEGMT